ncbi:MAG TPA: BON domain-containing protein [Polyangiaceae bacterium]|nr:BON domain-containing protein [Polyangiaceae bacterium]
MKNDADIKQDVIKELKWDTRVNETEIGVGVTSGVVTLTGTVNSWGKKLAAGEAAHRVDGALDVANDIAVKPVGSYMRTDTDIARAIRSALEWDVFIPDDRIRSTVSQGWVTLDGDVEYYNHRSDAERAVRNLAGVRGVTNQIVVSSTKVDPGEIRSSLEQALKRHAARDAKRIAIDISEGRVSLTGSVHSIAERDAVVGAARATPGVRAVVNHLRVEPYAA